MKVRSSAVAAIRRISGGEYTIPGLTVCFSRMRNGAINPRTLVRNGGPLAEE
jgi:hypothetical protein